MAKIGMIGGPGNIGLSFVEDLLAAGHEISIFTKTGRGAAALGDKVSVILGERQSASALRDFITTFRPEVIVDFVLFEPLHMEGIIHILEGTSIRYCFVSTVDTYGFPLSRLPMRESDPFASPLGRYAQQKRVCEEMLIGSSLNWTIVRPGYSSGNDFILSFHRHDGGLDLVPRLRAGRPVFVPDDGKTTINWGFAENCGRMIAAISVDPRTVREAFTCAHAFDITHDRYYEIMGGVLGVEPNLVHIPASYAMDFLVRADGSSLMENLTQFSLSFSVEKFQKFFPNFEWKLSLEEGFRRYVANADLTGRFRPTTHEIAEDRMISEWTRKRETYIPSDFEVLS